MRPTRACLALTVVLALPACAGGDSPAVTETAEPPVAETEPVNAPSAAALSDPRSEAMNKVAPDTFRARFTTTKGEFVIEVQRAWAPIGADHFYNLVRNRFYDDVRFFRVIQTPRPFMVQFGINGDPKLSAIWQVATLKDEPVLQSNTRGFVTYAKTGAPNSRSTQLFINFGDNSSLDRQGFSPFGTVIEGMDVVDSLNSEYGGAPSAEQGQIQKQGNAFLDEKYPNLDHIITARIE